MPQAIFAYHLGMDAEQYAFFRIPKLLITEPYFRRLSTDAKLLYGLMLDRMSLSMRNGWMDDDGHVYISAILTRWKNSRNSSRTSSVSTAVADVRVTITARPIRDWNMCGTTDSKNMIPSI